MTKSTDSAFYFKFQNKFSCQLLKITYTNYILAKSVLKGAFNSIKKYLQNNAVQEKSGKNKIPEKHLFFDKTGYRTTLGVPILINYSIFFQRQNEPNSLKQLNLQFDDIKILIL